MNRSTPIHTGERSISVERCRDPELIEQVLRRDYFDDPIRYLPENTIRTLARSWFARRSEIYFITAEVDGAYAGFVFAHTMGPALWRLFARRHPLHIPALLRAKAKMRKPSTPESRPAHVPSDAAQVEKIEAEIAALNLPVLPRPFAWAPADGRSGRIALLFTHSGFRGLGLAQHMLEGAARHMAASGVTCVEAHIDEYNISSVRAFMKAGWEVSRMSARDFWARKKVGE
ncbi:MAG TPA: GNAT family N-acetyltransferase [Pyrinomonadaceae bacterium]|jgi:GNAT superfamily N-acetyltransferase|nr:GNAT family N-acetyltransferase [Pyrinomonadaceae bacterium]